MGDLNRIMQSQFHLSSMPQVAQCPQIPYFQYYVPGGGFNNFLPQWTADRNNLNHSLNRAVQNPMMTNHGLNSPNHPLVQ